METAVIVAILALVGQILLAILQNKNLKTQAKKIETETSAILIDKALNISKQENEMLRLLNSTLKEELSSCKTDIKEKEVCIEKLEEQLDVCRDTVHLLEKELEDRK